jgi:hypothetical protein
MTLFMESIRDFLGSGIIVGDLLLPTRYPEIARFDDFQVGFRTHGRTGESLVSDTHGEWRAEWYVIALTGSDDPIFVDSGEGDIGYPVYSAAHGAGHWQALQIAPSLKAFGRLLEALAASKADAIQSERVIAEETGSVNKYWREVLDGRQEEAWDDAPADPGDFDPADYETGDLIVTDIGPQKLAVVRIISKFRDMPLKDALALTDAAEFEAGSGVELQLRRLGDDLEASGATVEFRAARR